jgi:glycogen(starch) synthase
MLYEDYLRPKRILMTADTIGGVWTYALELARALAPEGIEISLATLGAPLREDQREALRDIENLELYESRYKLEWMDDAWDDVEEAGIWLLRLEERIRPDLIHLNGYAHGSLPWRSPVLVVGHSCVISWWEAVLAEPAPASWDRYYREVARGLAAADIVAAPSMSMFWELNNNYGPIHCGRVIYNGRDPEKFKPGSKEEFILTAGRLWDRAKNIALVAEVAGKLPWPVYAAGGISGGDGGASGNPLRRLGYLSEQSLAAWYGRAPLFVLPAKYEPFGLCALEAGLSGCALVLGNIPSLREIWADAAVYVDPDDPDALEGAVMKLIGDSEYRREMGGLARERAGLYTAAGMAAGYKAIYRELAEGWHTSGNLFQTQKDQAAVLQVGGAAAAEDITLRGLR